jgi:hypothetical protein
MELSNNTIYSFTIDKNIQEEGYLLCKSIVENSPKSDVLVYSKNISELDNEIQDYINNNCITVEGDMPFEGHPISYKLKALEEAEKYSDDEYVVLLDTDIILFSPISIDKNSSIYAKPADVGAKYWCNRQSKEEWTSLYKLVGKNYPDYNIKSRIDKKQIIPFWNSGVVVTTENNRIGSEWLENMRLVIDNCHSASLSFFTDQIALALTISDKNVGHLSEYNNYLMGGRFRISDKVRILHYSKIRNLYRIRNKKIKNQIKELKDIRKPNIKELFLSFLDIMSFKSGIILSYKHKKYIKSILKKLGFSTTN